MVRLLKDQSLVAQWQKFLEEQCKSDIETVAIAYPEKRSLYVDYWDIDKADSKLGELLINQPYKAVYNAEEALKNIDVASENKLQLHFRVLNLPETNKLIVRKIRANHSRLVPFNVRNVELLLESSKKKTFLKSHLNAMRIKVVVDGFPLLNF
jgi:DNA replicative helicase MCM subunit Mcm2 (Cdc46/Mcm family)